MGLLTKLLGGGAKPVLDGAKGVLDSIDGLSTSQEEKATLRATVVTGLVQAQAEVLKAEYSSGSWLAVSWRPLLMLSWGAIITYSFFFAPMFGLRIVELPPELWSLLTLGIGGYVGGRSVEKCAETVCKAYSAKQLIKLKKQGIETE